MAHLMLSRADGIFDRIERRWESVVNQKRVATTLIAVFLVGLALTECYRRGWLPDPVYGWMADHGLDRHFDAILVAFTLLLLAEKRFDPRHQVAEHRQAVARFRDQLLPVSLPLVDVRLHHLGDECGKHVGQSGVGRAVRDLVELPRQLE